MANTIIDHTPAPFTIELDHVLRLASDRGDYEDMKEALAEYDELQRIAQDLVIPHLADPARAKLQSNGISCFDDGTFRHVFLMRAGGAQELQNRCFEIDGQIVAKLMQRASPIVKRIRQKAVDFLEGEIKSQAARSDEKARCAKFGLPEAAAFNGCYVALRTVREAIMAVLNDNVNLYNNGDRRGTLGRYFAKPL